MMDALGHTVASIEEDLERKFPAIKPRRGSR
jgi:hypothetical protein